MEIFVGNLNYDTSEDELRSAFAQFGEVARAQVIRDRETGRSRGFGFVEMADDETARRAIDGMNGSDLAGRRLTVNEARPRNPGGGGGGRRERW